MSLAFSEHKWFQTYMQHLKDTGCTVIAMRDMAKYLPAEKKSTVPR